MADSSKSGTPNLSTGPLGILPPPTTSHASHPNNGALGQANYHNMSLFDTPNAPTSFDIFAAPRQQYQNYSYGTLPRNISPQQLYHLHQPQHYNHQLQASQQQQHIQLPQIPLLSSQTSTPPPPPPVLHNDDNIKSLNYHSQLPQPLLQSSHSSSTLSSMGSMNSLSSVTDDVNTDTSQSGQSLSANSPSLHHGNFQLKHQRSMDGSPDLKSSGYTVKTSSFTPIRKPRRKSSQNLRKGIPVCPLPPMLTDIDEQQISRTCKPKFSADDDELLINLKEQRKLSWKQIAQHFNGRTAGALQVRYCTKLKRVRPSSWTEQEIYALKDAVRQYDAEKWSFVSEKLGNKYPPGRCREKHKEVMKHEPAP